MFIDLRPVPIVLWDESRLAVNALEMHLRGLSLVTTYEFSPDLWNTKPPLLIWLMQPGMAAFGPSEWTVRLPSLAAVTPTEKAQGPDTVVGSCDPRVTGQLKSIWQEVGAFGECVAVKPGRDLEHAYGSSKSIDNRN
jgi:hypothetical protein